MARHLARPRARPRRRIAALSVVLALSFGIVAVAQTTQSDRDLLISIHQKLHAAGIPDTPTSSSTTAPTTSSTNTTVTTAPTTSTTAPVTTFLLQYSTNANRSTPLSLAGSTVSGNIYVFTSPDVAGITEVRFWLDNPAHSGPPRITEVQAPYDFNGAVTQTQASPFNVSTLAAGSHSITAEIVRGATSQFVTASFAVPATPSTSSTTTAPTTSTSTATTIPISTTTTAAGNLPACPTPGAGLTNPSLLTVHQGNLTVNTNGALIQNLEIRGQLLIQANNVTVRNVWVWSTGFYTLRVISGSGTIIENVEVGKAGSPGERGIAGGNVTVRLVNIHDVEDGIKMGSNSNYDRMWIHDLDSPASAPHSDGMQNDGGPDNIVVTNSCIDSRTRGGGLGNAAIIVQSSLGAIDNVRVENNRLNGGNYTVFWREEFGNPPPTNGLFRNNQFGCQQRYGLFSVDGNGLTRTGNVWAPGCPNAGQLIPGG